MKQIFTLVALMASMSLFAQINETFETNTLAQLQSNCWQFYGISRSSNSPLTGSWGLEIIPTTSNPNTGNSNTGQIVSPFLNFTTQQTVSFHYRNSGNNGTRRAEIKLYDKFGVMSSVIANINLTATTKTLVSVTIPAGSGIKRLVIDFFGSGGGNVYQYFDDLSITAPYHYASICNQAPKAENDSYNAGVMGSYFGSSVLVNDSDPNAETLLPTVVSSPDGTVSMNTDGTFTFIPNNGFTGPTASFTYSITDNGYTPLTATATVTITFPQQAIILPIKLKAFTGSLNNNKVQLNWSVEDNETGSHFQVQRSEDGKDFSNTALLFTTNKSGAEMYAYTENLPFASGTYYRLQIINKDNSVTYSKVVVLKPQALATSNTLRVLQNPIFGNTIQLDLTGQIDESQQISLYDMAGNLVFTKQVRIQKGNNIIYLDVEKALSKGTYLLEARSSIQRRIIKITK